MKPLSFEDMVLVSVTPNPSLDVVSKLLHGVECFLCLKIRFRSSPSSWYRLSS